MTALAIALACWAVGAGGGMLLRRHPVSMLFGGGGAIAGAAAAGLAGAQALAGAVTQYSWTADRVLVGLYLPLFAAVARAGQRLRAYHQARVTWSLLYIGVTVLTVLTLLFLPGARR